jgi:hypothetical protein
MQNIFKQVSIMPGGCTDPDAITPSWEKEQKAILEGAVSENNVPQKELRDIFKDPMKAEELKAIYSDKSLSETNVNDSSLSAFGR